MPLFGSSNDVLEVTILLVGELPDEALLQIEGAIETHFKAECRPTHQFRLHDTGPSDSTSSGEDAETLHAWSYDPDRELYDAEKLLSQGVKVGGDKTITVTDVPIYYETGENYMGLAQVGGELGLVTAAEFWDGDQWTDQATARVRKETIKTLGRTLGAGDCNTEGCSMGKAILLDHVDDQDEWICDECRATIGEEHLR